MDIKLNKLFFVFCVFSIHLIPFASKFTFETFPILIILFSAFIFFFKNKKFSNYNKNKKYIFFLVAYLLLFYLVNLFGYNNSTIELIKYLIGPLIFLSYLDLKKFFGINEILLFGVLIISLYLIFIWRLPYIFDYSCRSLEFFIGRLDCANTNNLNRPFLITPEPSYLSLMLSFYLIILNHFKNDDKKYQIFIIIIEIFICFIIIQTSSRIGLLFVIFFVLYKFFYYSLHKKIIIITSLIFTISFLFVSNFSLVKKNNLNFQGSLVDSRNLMNIDRITSFFMYNQSPVVLVNCDKIYLDKDIDSTKQCTVPFTLFSVMNRNEPTGFIRIFHNYLSFMGSMDSKFLGNGYGSYANLWYEHAVRLNVDHLTKINEVMSKWHPDIKNKKQYAQNYFFSVLHDVGLIPALLIAITIIKSFINIIRNKNKFGYIIFLYVIMTFFLQSNITSPYPWLALAIILLDKKKYA